MAKFTLIEPYNSYSGKTCSHSNIINCLGHVGVRRDKQWTTQICHKRDLTTNPLSQTELRIRDRFKSVRTAVMGIKNDGTKYLQAANAFQAVKNQYKSFDAYLWALEGAKYDQANG